MQFHFLPLAVRYDGKAAVKGHGFQAHVGPMRSPSRGTVRLASADPATAPRIAFNYMSTERDWIEFRRCIRLARRDLRPAGLRRPMPGARSSRAPRSRAMPSSTPSSASTPKAPITPAAPPGWAAPTIPTPVVDPECRVIGVEGLRVVDSSIFPRITNGNLNAPSIMVGEKAADHILGRPALAAD